MKEISSLLPTLCIGVATLAGAGFFIHYFRASLPKKAHTLMANLRLVPVDDEDAASGSHGTAAR